MEAVRDRCGTIHLIVRHISDGDTHVDYMPSSERPGRLQHVDPSTHVAEADLAVTGQRLTLGWVGRDASGMFLAQVRTRALDCRL